MQVASRSRFRILITTCMKLQVDLEVFDGVSQGKYTIGLGQDTLGFCTDVEDVISMRYSAGREACYGGSPKKYSLPKPSVCFH